jgi:hypothetical protein
LLANRYRFTQADQFRQVVFYRMMRHPGHRDGFTCGGSAFRQRDVHELRCAFCIIIKQLVKVAHAIEEQDIRMLRFQFQILLHHWGVGVEIL